MVPCFAPEKDESRIMAKTTPLAPRRAVFGKKVNWMRPEMRAVRRITKVMLRLP